jgi:transcriptional regulator with XRE-family HTH domain
MTVGQVIRQMREERGWSQAKLGVLSGNGPSGISQIETGRRNPSAATLERIAKALGVEVRDLFPLGQTPLPDFGHEGFDAWLVTLEQYKGLRNQISDFDELGEQERRRVLEEALELFQELRRIYNPTDLQLALLHDALRESVLRMVGVYELEQERGNAEANVVDIEEYKARLRQSA